jgi:hypothetical protein
MFRAIFEFVSQNSAELGIFGSILTLAVGGTAYAASRGSSG